MRAVASLVLLAVVFVAAGCTGAAEDKAGGAGRGERVMLTLAVDDRPEVEEFAALVERRSGGSIRIDIEDGWRVDEPDYEQSTVEDVQHGRVDLASVGANIWDRLGVNAFRGLLAPFLVDSFALESKVVGDVALRERLLAAIGPLGLVGVAVEPGGLRRPTGLTRSLVAPADYDGATIGIRDGAVPEATFRALGAATEWYPGKGSIFAPGLDGMELGLIGPADNPAGPSGGQARWVTANVVLWPRIDTVVMNRRAFEALGRARQELLLRAGRDVFAAQLARVQENERRALETVCERGGVSFVTATQADLAALRAAVAPVYVELMRDPWTRRVISDVRRLRREAPPPASEQPRCSGFGRRAAGAAGALEGLWLGTATKEDVLAADAPAEEIERVRAMPAPRRTTMRLEDGRWLGRADDFWEVSGTYRVSGDVIRFTIGACKPVGSCDPGAFTDYAWSLYRNTLTLERIPGRWAWPSLTAKPWRRVG